MNIGERIDDLVKQRETIRQLSKDLDALKDTFNQDSQGVLEELETQGMAKATGTLGTASVSSTTVAHVLDWDKVYNYILRNKSFHLVQRRISDGAFRETLENRKGKNIPGIEPFVKKGINLRAL